jgi:hypothetical protein
MQRKFTSRRSDGIQSSEEISNINPDSTNSPNDSNLSPEQTVDYSHNQSESSEPHSSEYSYNPYNGDSGSGGEPPTDNNESQRTITNQKTKKKADQ